MKNELISVIIPMYNTQAYIEECLLSVQRQSYPDFECVIVDDGSTDASLQTAMDFSGRDDRFRVICQEHAGVAQAVANGIAAAKGQWLYFLDSDDWIDADELAYLYALLTENRCDMVTSNYTIEADSPKIGSIVRFRGVVERNDFPELFYHQFVCNERYNGIVCGNTRGGKLVRRTLAQENVRLQEGMVFAEDAIMMLGVLCDCERVCADPDHAGYHYRKHNRSSMHNYGVAYVAHRASYAQRIREVYTEKGIAGDPRLEQNYLRFELYNLLGSLHYIGFDMKTVEKQFPDTYVWMQETIEKLSHMDKRILGKRKVWLLWMLRHRMSSVLTVLYAANHYLRYTLKISQ